MELIIIIIIITISICSSFIFGAAETAFSSIKPWQIKLLAKENDNRSFDYLVDNIQNIKSTLALGKTTFNSCIIATCVLALINFDIVYYLAFLVILLVSVALFCEIIPKTLAINSPQNWVKKLYKPIYFFYKISIPISLFAEKINNFTLRLIIPKGLHPNSATTEEEFAELIDWAYQQGVLEKSEREILEEIIRLDKKTAEIAMKPRSDMVCIGDDLPIEDMLSEAKTHKYTRLPIFNETTDNIVGILNTRQLLIQPESDLSESIEFPSFVPSTMNLMDLLHSLQQQRRGLAIVLDEFGGTAGLITTEDILEELVGEMREEGEKIEFTIEKLNRNRWRVNGSLSIEDFSKLVPELKKLPEVDTMGGLIVALKEFVPKNGESIKYCGLELTVVAANERRVKELIVKKI